MTKAPDNRDSASDTSDYRFENVSFKLILEDMSFSKEATKPGQTVPNFDVYNSEGQKLKLYDLSKDKPLLIITGSITCPMTISSIPSVRDFQNKMADKVNIALVYVREAHPGEKFPQPASIEEKIQHAKQLHEFYDTDFPIIIDGIDGDLHKALDIMPNSAHLIDTNGTLLFQSLFATDHSAIEKALQAVSRGESVEKTQSQSLIRPMIGAAGYMNKTFNLAGPRSHKEMLIHAFPVYLWSLISAIFFFLPEKYRGVFGLATLSGAMVAGAWFLFAN